MTDEHFCAAQSGWFHLVAQVQVPNPSPPSCTDVMADREQLQRSDFVGGVSDGSIGCAVMDYRPRGRVHLHRSWFMLDRVVVVANIGIFVQNLSFCLSLCLCRSVSVCPPACLPACLSGSLSLCTWARIYNGAHSRSSHDSMGPAAAERRGSGAVFYAHLLQRRSLFVLPLT